MSLFKVKGETLYAGSSKLEFAHPVVQLEDFGSVGVVRLEVPPGAAYNENIFGVSVECRILWQIGEEPHVYEDSPYTHLGREGAFAVVGNWDGLQLWLEPNTGKVVKRVQGK